jgi:hypothetical protein
MPKFGCATPNIPFCIKTEYCQSVGRVSMKRLTTTQSITKVIAFLFWSLWGNENPLKESRPRVGGDFECLFFLTLTLHFVRVRCAAIVFILCRAAKNEPRKRAKGSNTPWIPATCKRRCAVTPLMFARRWAVSTLASVFSRKTPTRKAHASREARVFDMCYAPVLVQILNKTG